MTLVKRTTNLRRSTPRLRAGRAVRDDRGTGQGQSACTSSGVPRPGAPTPARRSWAAPRRRSTGRRPACHAGSLPTGSAGQLFFGDQHLLQPHPGHHGVPDQMQVGRGIGEQHLGPLGLRHPAKPIVRSPPFRPPWRRTAWARLWAPPCSPRVMPSWSACISAMPPPLPRIFRPSRSGRIPWCLHGSG